MGRSAMNEDQPSLIDLFAGAGGLSAACERAGFRTVSAIDIDPDCIASMRATQEVGLRIGRARRRYLEGAKLLQGDIREVNRSDLKPDWANEDWRPDVLAGGPPCQPFSSAGLGKALDDPRGQLFAHFVRLAVELRPRLILFENVSGLVTAKGLDGKPGGVLKLIQRSFEEAGYACRFQLLNAADYGAPQRRVRLYMVATSDEALPEFPRAKFSQDQSGGLRPWLSLREYLRDFPAPLPADVVRPSGKRASELEQLRPGTGLKSCGIVEANRPSGHWGYRQDSFVADLNAPSRTIRAASTPDWIKTPEGLRRLTWKECAALQGFPDRWVFEGSRTSQFRQIGNAVQGHIGEAIARVLRSALRTYQPDQPKSAPWPTSFHRRVRYTAMEARVNGRHRETARAQRGIGASRINATG